MESINQKFHRHAILRSTVALCRSERFYGDKLDERAQSFFYKPVLQQTDFALLVPEELYDLGIAPIPSRLENAFICQKLYKVYGESLFIAGIFKREEGLVLIDIDPRLARRGFFLPVRTRKNVWYGLLVYRSEHDHKPFYLKSRETVNA